jgi:aspartyl-tRNA(Asn)/glutamyl-tRNA(Gln) amidotransferase subunit A
VTPGRPPTIRELGTRIRDGQLRAADLMDAALGRAAATEPLVSAYAHVDWQGARRAALEADRELAAGQDRGPLHGIPFAVKDVILTRDMPTRAGSDVPLDNPVERDATVVQRLRQAGCVLIGKHVTHEFACGQNVPPTRNAWDHDRYPGGSSAGAGVSVALGSSLVAIGTDAGGSVRKPAALNGVVGLKPTFGRVSRFGVLPPSGSMDHVGVVTRYVEDAATVLQTIAGADEHDPSTRAEPVPDYTASLSAGCAGVRIGVLQEARGDADDAGTSSATAAAIDLLEQLGAVTVPVTLTCLDAGRVAGEVLLAAEAGSSQLRLLRAHSDAYAAATRRYLTAGAVLPAAVLLAAESARERLCREVRALFEDHRLDVLLTPTTPLPAVPVHSMVIGRDLAHYVRHTLLANLTGLPAITVPCGLSAGLPVGLQLVARPLKEEVLFAVAASYEAAAAWAHLCPPAAS